jgi:hypothetical protein
VTTIAPEGLDGFRSLARMTFDELWVAYFALGGSALPGTVRTYLDGSASPAIDYDVLAHALNERFSEQGANHPVPYHDELP